MSHINTKEKDNVTVSNKLRVDSLNSIERTKKNEKQKKADKRKLYGKLATLAIDT